MTGRGARPEERAAARQRRTAARRTAHYVDLMRTSTTPVERLAHACDYLRAVANDCTDTQVNELARAVAQLAEKGRHA